jgi:hypothetical protein
METEVAEVPAVAGDQWDIDGEFGQIVSGMVGRKDNGPGGGCEAGSELKQAVEAWRLRGLCGGRWRRIDSTVNDRG